MTPGKTPAPSAFAVLVTLVFFLISQQRRNVNLIQSLVQFSQFRYIFFLTLTKINQNIYFSRAPHYHIPHINTAPLLSVSGLEAHLEAIWAQNWAPLCESGGCDSPRRRRKSRDTLQYAASEDTGQGRVLCFSVVFYLPCCRDVRGDCHPRCPRIALIRLSCPARWTGDAVDSLTDLNDPSLFADRSVVVCSQKPHCVFHRFTAESCAVPLPQSSAEAAAAPSQAPAHRSPRASGDSQTAFPTPLSASATATPAPSKDFTWSPQAPICGLTTGRSNSGDRESHVLEGWMRAGLSKWLRARFGAANSEPTFSEVDFLQLLVW